MAVRISFATVTLRGRAVARGVRGAGNVRVDSGWLYRGCDSAAAIRRPYVRQSSEAEDLVGELCEDFRAADALEFGAQLARSERGWFGLDAR